jgi:hypothetical protein
VDIVLEMFYQCFFVKDLEKVPYIKIFFFYFFLDGINYGAPDGTAMTEILDMGSGKHNLHFLLGVELLQHAFVNIPNKKMHIVFFYIFQFYSYIFIRSFLTNIIRL